MAKISHDEVESPFVSFADALTGVLLIFLILVLVLALNQQSAANSEAMLEEKIKDLKEEMSKLIVERDDLGMEISILQDKYSNLFVVVGNLEFQRDEAQGQLDVLQINLGQGFAQLGEIGETIAAKDQIIAGLNNQIAEAQTKEGNLSASMLVLETQIAAVTDIYQKVVDDVEAIKIELGALDEQKAARSGELEQIMIAISHGNEQARSLEGQIATLSVQLDALTRQGEVTNSGRDKLFDGIEASLARDGVRGVSIDRANDSVVMEEGILFDTGSAEIKSPRALRQIIATLEKLLPCSTAGMRKPNNCDASIGKLSGVVIEGHADRQGTAGMNMQLSSERALAVYGRIMASTTLSVARPYGTGAGGASLFDVAGYGENRPAVRTADGVNEPRNRRIVIRLVFRAG